MMLDDVNCQFFVFCWMILDEFGCNHEVGSFGAFCGMLPSGNLT